MAKNYSREKREFIAWLATPPMERSINTQKALAERLGVHEVTLSEWRHQPDVVAEVNKLVDLHFADDYPEIAESFKLQSRLGSYQHQKTYFEMIGKYSPPRQEVAGEISLRVIYDDSTSTDTDEA
jgi:hypothetical protein